jgi:hypothetical protein
MSWANIRELLFQERKILDPGPMPDFPPESAFEIPHSGLLASYLGTKADVDAAVMMFAQNLEWPEMKPLEKFFIVARLDFAWEIVSILTTARDGETLISYPSPDRCTTAELLQWLLIEIWPYGCGRFLQSQKWITEQPVIARKPHVTALPAVARAKCVA